MDTVLITGANRGIGLELAKQYAADGWRVFACARRSSPGLAGLAGIHGEVQVCTLDVSDHGQIDRLALTLCEEAIDVLINNAGTMGKSSFGAGATEDQSFGHTDFDDWERIFRVNVAGPMKMAEAFVEHVARSRQKKLVTLTSMVGSMGLNSTGGLYGYRASKAAVNAIVKSMSIDLLPRGILAIALHPGWVRTELGGPSAPLDVAASAGGLRRVIGTLDRESLGKVIAHDGAVLPY
jgi:NAD(P)-dependent dehydrogenase (short-subunit alcohol dehydrogenase family)